MSRKNCARMVIVHSVTKKERIHSVLLMAFGSILLLGDTGAGGQRLFYWLFSCILFVAGFADYFIRTIPNEMVLLAIMLWCLCNTCFRKPIRLVIIEVFLALLFSMGIFLVVAFLESRKKKQLFGRGDIKLLFAVALFMGIQKALYILAFACICSVFTILLTAKYNRERYFPFGPYIAFSCFSMLFLL